MKTASLSASMVNSYLKCPRSFYYNYALKLPWLPNHYIAFGAAFHETLRENYWQKIESSKDLPLDLLQDFFAEDLEYRDADWSQQSMSETKDQGVKTIKAYQQKVAIKTQPTHVEHEFVMAVTGRDWNIRGKIDLIDEHLTVTETKTTGRRVYKPKPDHVFQTSVYTAAWQQQTKRFDLPAKISYSLRGADEINSFPIEFDDTLARNVLTSFAQVARGIEAEVWPANRGHIYCTKRFCYFANQCEKDCGGTVAE
jgi:CRISPR/Cas system-associated exonuclease Cas4 (RecB family)